MTAHRRPSTVRVRTASTASGCTWATTTAPVVHGADIALRAGRVTALVGPNGSGKSTLLRALARLHRPTAGELALAGRCRAASTRSA